MTKFAEQLNNAFDPNHIYEDGKSLCALDHPWQGGKASNTFDCNVSLSRETLEEATILFNKNYPKGYIKGKCDYDDDPNKIINYVTKDGFRSRDHERNVIFSSNLEFIAKSIKKEMYDFYDTNMYDSWYTVDSLKDGYWFIVIKDSGTLTWREVFGAQSK